MIEGVFMDIYILLLILIIASVWDYRTLRIPNALTIIGVLIGLLTSFYLGGFNHLKESLIAIFITLFVFFLLWALLEILKAPAIGAGDIKLLVVISSFLGFQGSVTIFYYSIILASIIFLFIISPKKIINMFIDLIYFVFYYIPFKKEENYKKLAFSIPLFLSTVFYVLF